jgi:hypothetical protein
MNIDFTDAFENGMSEQEALEMVQRVCREEQEKAEAKIKAQAAAHRAKDQDKKEALKAEGRAYAINAILAYIEAFGLLPEDETMDAEDVGRLEQLLIKIENMIPVYFKLFQMQDDLKESFEGDLGLGGSFFGPF